jgi:hypothetical protein
MSTLLIQAKSALKKQFANGYIDPIYAKTYMLSMKLAQHVSLVRKHAKNRHLQPSKEAKLDPWTQVNIDLGGPWMVQTPSGITHSYTYLPVFLTWLLAGSRWVNCLINCQIIHRSLQ